MAASIMTVNFLKADDITQHASGRTAVVEGKKERPRTADGKLLTAKQIRARARRKMARSEVMTSQELSHLYQKPVEEWDLEELARGRPRNAKGTFTGRKPAWIRADIHEEAMTKYTAAVKGKMRETTVDALGLLTELINSTDVDDKGKPIVPPGTKLDAAKFLIEHVIGKPTQRIENDVSVKLQGILGQVMVNPGELSQGAQSYNLAHFPGHTMELATAQDGDDDDQYFGE